MGKENKTSMSVFDMISGLQRVLFYITLVIIPWFIIPLPYDSTEMLKSIVFIFLSSFIILLEIIKWIWDGKVSVTKSIFDKVFLLLFVSFLVSTVFARDSWIAMWGYDGRIGGGLFVMIFLFGLFYLGRGLFQKKEEVVKAVFSLSLGISILIVLSLLSVFSINIFGWVPYVNEFFVVGLPLTFSYQEAMLVAGSGILLNGFLIINSLQDKKYQSLIVPIIGLTVAFISIPIFAINRGALLPILLFVVLLPVIIMLWTKLNKSQKGIPIFIFILSSLVLAFSIGFQYESFRTSVLGEDFSTVTPISLGSDISWQVASSPITSNFTRGLVGLGNDSFGVAYHAFRPGGNTVTLLGNTTFVTGSNELFTALANRGLIGVTVWVLLGLVYLRFLIKQIVDTKGQKKVLSFMLSVNAMFIFLGSLFVPFSFLVYFLLFVSTLLLIVLNSKDGDNEEFLLKFWAVNVGGSEAKDINKTMEGINWFFTIVVTLMTTAGLILLFVRSMSLAYVVRAEAYNIEKNREYADFEGEISIDVREEYLVRMANYYDKALGYNMSNPYVNRKASLVALEIVSLLGEKTEDAEEDEADAFVSEISVWKNTAIDLSKKATTISPITYANWNTRASVYIGLIEAGLSSLEEDALSALQSCVNLNPYDYDSYYKAGRIQAIKQDYDRALASLNTAINIYGDHIPSILLAGDIYAVTEDTENAITYYKAVKEILELNEVTSGELYEAVMDRLESLGADLTEEETQEEEVETEEEETQEEEELPVEGDLTEDEVLLPNENDEELLTE
jgi:tetratricopeptide (TPR) repeat protein